MAVYPRVVHVLKLVACLTKSIVQLVFIHSRSPRLAAALEHFPVYATLTPERVDTAPSDWEGMYCAYSQRNKLQLYSPLLPP